MPPLNQEGCKEGSRRMTMCRKAQRRKEACKFGALKFAERVCSRAYEAGDGGGVLGFWSGLAKCGDGLV